MSMKLKTSFALGISFVAVFSALGQGSVRSTVTVASPLNYQQAPDQDPVGLLRMGERYRDGDGVTKDLAKARNYFIKADAAGEPSAAD